VYGSNLSGTLLDLCSACKLSRGPFATTLLTKLAVDPAAIPHYTLQSGLLCYNGRVWIGDDPAFHQQLITNFTLARGADILAYQ